MTLSKRSLALGSVLVAAMLFLAFGWIRHNGVIAPPMTPLPDGIRGTAYDLCNDAVSPGCGDADRAGLSGERVLPSDPAPLACDRGAAGLAQTLRKLRTRASLLLVVAHPDDEDGGMLAYEGRGQGAQTAMLTLTRGESGQNRVSGDLDDALGLVRTQELLAADRYFGVEQMFGSQIDFGYSRTKEESLAKWGHARVLYDTVRAIRLMRPLVVVSVFVGGPSDGHGQHQVAGEVAQEAYRLAGDPTVFPDQLARGLQPWSPLKYYAELPDRPHETLRRRILDALERKPRPAVLPRELPNYATGASAGEPLRADVTIHENAWSADLAATYFEFAHRGLLLQKTQVDDRAWRSSSETAYHRYTSRVPIKSSPEESFFDGIDTSLPGIATLVAADSTIGGTLRVELAQLDRLAQQATAEASAQHPEAAAPFLIEGLGTLDGLLRQVGESNLAEPARTDLLHELRVKRVQFNLAAAQAMDLRIVARMAPDASPETVASQPIAVQIALSAGQVPANALEKIAVQDRGALEDSAWTPVPVRALNPNAVEHLLEQRRVSILVPAATPPTRQPFTRETAKDTNYTPIDPALRLAPLAPPPLVAWATLRFGTVEVQVASPVMAEAASTPAPVSFVPAISVAMPDIDGVFPLDRATVSFAVRITGNVPRAHGVVRLELPPGWKAQPAIADFRIEEPHESIDVPFTLTPPDRAPGVYSVSAVATLNGREYREGYRSVGYSGLAPVDLYRSASFDIVRMALTMAPGLKVGYVAGAGDSIPEALANLGAAVTPLSASDVVSGRLNGFDAVVLSVRTYSTHPELAAAGSKALLEYASTGGTVVVFDQTPPFDGRSAPYDLSLGSGQKVVEEDGPVAILNADHRLLLTPNRISPRDFDGWAEERGHGFTETWDPRYEPLLEMHDRGQPVQKGGLLAARTGRGTWIYCALALHRQVSAGVPGAYCLLANLVSVGKRSGSGPE